jgi:hypothetical protein
MWAVAPRGEKDAVFDRCTAKYSLPDNFNVNLSIKFY